MVHAHGVAEFGGATSGESPRIPASRDSFEFGLDMRFLSGQMQFAVGGCLLQSAKWPLPKRLCAYRLLASRHHSQALRARSGRFGGHGRDHAQRWFSGQVSAAGERVSGCIMSGYPLIGSQTAAGGFLPRGYVLEKCGGAGRDRTDA